LTGEADYTETSNFTQEKHSKTSLYFDSRPAFHPYTLNTRNEHNATTNQDELTVTDTDKSIFLESPVYKCLLFELVS
jgi:hypothetical protein